MLLGPAAVEFAPYGRMPTSKPRRDARQGTIDQDPEFIDFLESLTNPIAKAPGIDVGADKENKVDDANGVTPLIQYIKDKKANKNKEPSAPAKSLRHSRQESKENKSLQSEKKAAPKGGKESGGGVAEKKPTPPVKVEKPSREASKAPAKQLVAPMKPAASPKTQKATPVQETAPTPPPPSAPKQERRRERGNASAAAKILQRDLGISQNPQSRRRREATPTTSAAASTSDPASSTNAAEATPDSIRTTQTSQSSQVTSTSKTNSASIPPLQPPSAPAATRNQARGKPQPATTARPKQSSAPAPKPTTLPSITPGATQAFLKHANPSQGVTEPLLEEAFAPFGTVQKVEIDKKKGFAYIDFADTETLQKAIAASPVKVAQGQVVVLERKTGTSLQNRNARGGGVASSVRGGANPQPARGGRGGGRGRGGRGQINNSKAVASPAAASTNPPAENTTTTATATSSSPAPEPPTAVPT